jgi:hypothetical protein
MSMNAVGLNRRDAERPEQFEQEACSHCGKNGVLVHCDTGEYVWRCPNGGYSWVTVGSVMDVANEIVWANRKPEEIDR